MKNKPIDSEGRRLTWTSSTFEFKASELQLKLRQLKLADILSHLNFMSEYSSHIDPSQSTQKKEK